MSVGMQEGIVAYERTSLLSKHAIPVSNELQKLSSKLHETSSFFVFFFVLIFLVLLVSFLFSFFLSLLLLNGCQEVTSFIATNLSLLPYVWVRHAWLMGCLASQPAPHVFPLVGCSKTQKTFQTNFNLKKNNALGIAILVLLTTKVTVGPIHTRDCEPMSIALEALSLVENAEPVQVHSHYAWGTNGVWNARWM